jgi:hypothetical protein
MNKFFSLHIDLLGFITSFICALHCIAVPLIFSLGLMGTSGLGHNHLFDALIVGVGLFIAGYSIVKDFKKYGNLMPFSVGVTGILLLLLGLNGHEAIHITCSILGGLMLASAHYLNWKINHSITCAK